MRVSGKRPLWLIAPAVVLVLCLVGSFLTRGAMESLQFLRSHRNSAGRGDIVDQQPLQTAQTLSALAVSAEEQARAHEALRIADHEVDQAFAMALRQASLQTRALTGKALEASKKVAALQAIVKDDQAAVNRLTAEGKKRPEGSSDDDLDVAKAQLGLDSDELADAQTALAILSGDQRDRIQNELTAHNAAEKKYDEQHIDTGQTAVVSARRFTTLAGRLKAWVDQLNRLDLLQQAKAQADADTATLSAQLATLQKQVNDLARQEQQDRSQVNSTPAPGGSRLNLIRSLQSQRQILDILNDRISSQQQLSENYGKWLAQVELQHQIVLHLLFSSLAWIAVIVLCAVLAAMLVRSLVERRMAGRSAADRRSMHTLMTVLQLVIQVTALIFILLVIFGPPSQVPTILGLATAGLTVVFQDFILSFFGWFVLMGRDGIRVGDWIEIDGVAGEVVEIGLFRTSLLETGNWTDNGHPTGRRITFANKFAISGQYFNFSTSGQWMWEELKLSVPATEESYAVIERIHQAVLAATVEETQLAQREWQRSIQRHGLDHFSAEPTVHMQLGTDGIDLTIHYVTRASDRFERRTQISQAVLKAMREEIKSTLAASAS